MVDKDIRWFKYLADALKEKYRNPQLVYYQGHHFEPTIYKWMRQTFDTLHTRYGINYEDYMNIGERPVLEKLIRNLQTDPRLSFLKEPTAVEAGQIELPDEFHQTIEQEQLAQQQAVPGGAPPQAAAPGPAPAQAPPRMAMPQMPAFPTSRQAPPEQPPAGETKETGQKPSQEGKTPQMGRRFNFPKMPTFAKNAGSNAGIFFKKTTSRAAVAASKGIGAGIGAGGRSALRAGNFGINFGLNFSNEFSRLRVGAIGKKWLLGLLLLLFLLGMLLFATGAGPIPPPAAGGNISMCLFTRSDQSPPDAKIKSSTLVNLFSEAERITTVPAKVLAAIARIESPTFVANADNNHDAFFNRNYTDITTSCAPHFPTSPTGALGMMQIQPKGTTGHFGEGVNYGASFFGKTADTLTVADYCDVKKSILLAAGFTIKKLKAVYNLGDGIKWDPAWTNNQDIIKKAAETYYGCLPYPSCSTGPYNYGDDMWKSVSSCVVSSISTCTPPPAGDLRQSIIDNFTITMNGFSQTQLEWTWEKLSCVSGTKFKSLTTGTTLTRIESRTSEQTGCRTINLGNYDVKTTFQVAFTHELGHIIDNCNTNELSRHTELYNVVYPTEGALTTYSRLAPLSACSGPGQASEDYAEMTTYHLNPDSAEIGPCLSSTIPPNPYAGGAHPLHHNLAATILGSFNGGSPPLPGLPQFSCPIAGGGKNILPSYQLDPTTYGHCGDLYVAKEGGVECSAGRDSRRAKSVDIETCINPRPTCSVDKCLPLTDTEKATYLCGGNGKNIVLPTINGQIVSWQYISSIGLTKSDCFDYEILDPVGIGEGCGTGYVFSTQSEGSRWVLHLLHLQTAPLVLNNSYPSGTVLGKGQAIHVHISIGKDIVDPLSQNESGWIPADKELNLCDSRTNIGYK